jgi:hypothetical protein
MNLKDQKIRTRVLIGATGVLALAGLGIGAANAATPATATTQTTSVVSPSPGDAADVPGAVETPGTAGAQETPGDTGPDVQQAGEHTDPGDAPGSP